jgi:mono/diheme cytochrome c family protein
MIPRCYRFTIVAGMMAFQSAVGAPGDYLTKVKPVFKERCYACHGALKQKAGLRLDTADLIRKGGDDGSVLDLSEPSLSKILKRVTHSDEAERMPPEGKPLSADQVAALREWIAAGAPVPPDERGDDDPRDHWAFQKIGRPEIPGNGEVNPIDAFLTAKQSVHSLVPQSEAPRSILLRRIYVDLIGLPPTRKQLADTRELSAIVDELLANPHHGERWGRHWMDVWRYSDWYGLGAQLRYSQKHIWRWRDWIIDSLNADKGYDRMILEMLAGDELAPDDPKVLPATGFLARNYYLFNRTTWLDSTIEHTGKAFLGLTLNCAKCHDHKYDPITHVDYYRFRAIFEPHHVRLDPVPGETNFEKDGLPRVYDDQLEAVTHLHLRGDPKNPDTSSEMEPGVPAMLASFAPAIEPLELSYTAHTPGARAHVHAAHLKQAEQELAKAEAALEKAKQNEEAAKQAPPPSEFAIEDHFDAPNDDPPDRVGSVEKATDELEVRQAKVRSLRAIAAADRARSVESDRFPELGKIASRCEAELALAEGTQELIVANGDKAKMASARKMIKSAEEKLAGAIDENPEYRPIRASRKALETPEHKFEDYPVTYPSRSTGRRLALAKWVVHRDNPLTARVAVNHVWTRHFGAPLVESMFDFGRRAKRPEHAALLDLLAVELIESGWSLCHLHRLIVGSEAYRRTSSNAGADPATRRQDPENVFYWKANPRRMESEIVRDHLLHLGGALDPAIGGPSIDPKDGGTRRGLYFLHSRDQKDQFLSMFDHADHLRCYRRKESIAPQQALALSNSKLSIEMAEKIAAKIAGSELDSLFVDAAFEMILCRLPDSEERAECRTFEEELAKVLPDSDSAKSKARVRARLVHALLNHNDFVTIR